MNKNFNSKEFRDDAKIKRESEIKDFQDSNTVRGNYLRNIPMLFKWGLLRIYNGENSPTKAIKAKCLDCTCYQKNEVKNCEVFTCPLYNFRPYRDK